MDKEIQVVGFRIGRETFGLPIELVREIVRVPEITSVPNAPDYIEGVINLRGRIIPIVDLRKRFGEKTFEPHNVFKEGELNYITGVGKLKGRLVILLDLHKILQRGELLRIEEAADSVAEPVTVGTRRK